MDKLHSKGFLSAVFDDYEDLWYYSFITIDGLDFYFSDNPVETMLTRDLAQWQHEPLVSYKDSSIDDLFAHTDSF